MPPKQTDERLARLLTALEVPDSELTKARVVVGSSALVALRVQPDYTVVWFIAPARDWAAYLAAFAFHHVQTITVPGGDRANVSDGGGESTPRTAAEAALQDRPRRAPRAVRRAMLWALKPELAFQMDRNSAALDGFLRLLGEYRQGPAPDRQVTAYLMLRAIGSAAHADRMGEVVPLVEEAELHLREMYWVWLDATEAKRGEEVRIMLLGILADARASAGDTAGAIAASERRALAASSLQDRRTQAGAAIDFAILVQDSDPPRAKELANSALADFTHLGDIEGQGKALQIQANLKMNARDPGAPELFEEASGLLERAGEASQAAHLLGIASDRAADHGDLHRASELLAKATRIAPADDARFHKLLAEHRWILEANLRAPAILSPDAAALLASTQQLARQHESWAAGTGHLLLAALDSPSPAVAKLLRSKEVDATLARARLIRLLPGEARFAGASAATGTTMALRKIVQSAVHDADMREATTVSTGAILTALLEAPVGYVAVALKALDMFDCFTDRAMRVARAARDKARASRQDHIDSEHLLLSLIDDGAGPGVRAMSELGIPPTVARKHLEARLSEGAPTLTGYIPLSPAAKSVLILAVREALLLNHPYVGSEHLLLGLIREADGVAAQVLTELGADLTSARITVRQHAAEVIDADTNATVTVEALGDVWLRYSGDIFPLGEGELRRLEHPDLSPSPGETS